MEINPEGASLERRVGILENQMDRITQDMEGGPSRRGYHQRIHDLEDATEDLTTSDKVLGMKIEGALAGAGRAQRAADEVSKTVQAMQIAGSAAAQDQKNMVSDVREIKEALTKWDERNWMIYGGIILAIIEPVILKLIFH